MMRTTCSIAAAIAIGLLVPGCGSGEDKWVKERPKTVPAKGVLTLDGKPLDAAQVVLVGAGEGASGGSGLSDAEGKFELSTFPPAKGIVPGSYRVMIVKSNVPETQDTSEEVYTPPATATILVPVKYTTPDTSNLTIDVPESGKEDIKLELTSN
jgi:hypothetical protein